jgi:phosphoribosylformimino-5-aminoimidazole carboxamide ribotide isomerase
MKIIPAIDIKNGKCVRLFQGDYSKETIYEDDPVIVAKKWEAQGAQILHVVDLDGAKNGKAINMDIIRRLVKAVKIPVQMGGGIRDFKSIFRKFDMRAERVILGTAALEDEKLLSKAIGLYREKIIVSLDSKNGILMKNGWLEKSDSELFSALRKLENMGISSIIYTDTIKHGTLSEPNYEVIKSIRENTKMSLIVAGGISSIEQIKKLKNMNVDEVIIGKALYEGKINLKEAISLC